MVKVLVIGSGSIGSWVAKMLETAGIEYTLVDDDVIEERNLQRLPPEARQWVGAPKSLVFTGLHGKPVVNTFSEEMLDGHDAVIEATDSLNVQKTVAEIALSRGVHFISPKFDGRRISLLVNVSPWFENEGGGYTTEGPVSAAVIAAAMAVDALLRILDGEYVRGVANLDLEEVVV